MIYLVVTIDVEPDCTPNWKYSNPLSFHGVHTGIRECLQPLFNVYGITPTYLINNVVLEDDRCAETLFRLEGRFELGTHLHPEFMDPHKIYPDYAGKKGEANQCFLDSNIEFEKMNNITELFARCFGKMPTSFRAGRFSAGNNTIKCLEILGYKVDTSVTPHVNWNDKSREMPVDYSSAPEQPYFVRHDSILEPDIRGMILEVPVTVNLKKTIFREKYVWLRPSLASCTDMIILIKNHINKASNKPLVLNMMFHNVELIPNKSPYTKTANDVEKYLEKLRRVLAYCKHVGIASVGLTELHGILSKYR